MSYLVHVKSKHVDPKNYNLFLPNKLYIFNCKFPYSGGTTIAEDLTEKCVYFPDGTWLKEGYKWNIVKVQEVVSREKILSLIENAKGKFLCVWFIKKDGTKRRLIGRFGVKVGLKTEDSKPTVDTNKYFVLYDTEVKGYRAVNKETIYEVSVGGKNYVVEE